MYLKAIEHELIQNTKKELDYYILTVHDWLPFQKYSQVFMSHIIEKCIFIRRCLEGLLVSLGNFLDDKYWTFCYHFLSKIFCHVELLACRKVFRMHGREDDWYLIYWSGTYRDTFYLLERYYEHHLYKYFISFCYSGIPKYLQHQISSDTSTAVLSLMDSVWI